MKIGIKLHITYDWKCIFVEARIAEHFSHRSRRLTNNVFIYIKYLHTYADRYCKPYENTIVTFRYSVMFVKIVNCMHR